MCVLCIAWVLTRRASCTLAQHVVATGLSLVEPACYSVGVAG